MDMMSRMPTTLSELKIIAPELAEEPTKGHASRVPGYWVPTSVRWAPHLGFSPQPILSRNFRHFCSLLSALPFSLV
jgi:hypothetical protein